MLLYVYLFIGLAVSLCHDPSPAFPLPVLGPDNPVLQETFRNIQHTLQHAKNKHAQDVSFSVEITSSLKTLWSSHFTADHLDPHGAAVINDKSVYRIASISKTFTTLALLKQAAAGSLHLDDSVLKYVPRLSETKKLNLAWKEVTLRTLASQLSGLPRNALLGDAINWPFHIEALALPEVSRENLPTCSEYSPERRACTPDDFFKAYENRVMVYPPNQQSTYSNDAFSLLGLVLENVTGKSYNDLIQTSIFDDLKMSNSYTTKPADNLGAIPITTNWWPWQEGVQAPTGGLYTCTSDMSIFLRYILTSYNGLTNGVLNWFSHLSLSTGMNSFYGIPWETFRTDKILTNTKRPVTFFTKSGGLPGYISVIMLLPEHGLGISIFGAGEIAGIWSDLINAVTVPLVKAVDDIAMQQLASKYAGTYSGGDDTRLEIAVKPNSGLIITSFNINGTDVLAGLHNKIEFLGGSILSANARMQLVPTLLFADQTNAQGELWRAMPVDEFDADAPREVWDDFCPNNIDWMQYAGRPFNQLVFWGGDNGEIKEVELSGWRLKLAKVEGIGEGKEGRVSEEL